MCPARFAKLLVLQVVPMPMHFDRLAILCALTANHAPAFTRLVLGCTAAALALPVMAMLGGATLLLTPTCHGPGGSGGVAAKWQRQAVSSFSQNGYEKMHIMHRRLGVYSDQEILMVPVFVILSLGTH
jgi:hypothetical protein